MFALKREKWYIMFSMNLFSQNKFLLLKKIELILQEESEMSKNILLLLTSTAFGGLISMLIGFYQWRIKAKRESDEQERDRLYSDIKYYHKKYRQDEDEIDMLKDEIRKLKEQHPDVVEKEEKLSE